MTVERLGAWTWRARVRAAVGLQLTFSGLNAAQAAVAYEESAVAVRALVDRLGLKTIGMIVQALDRGDTLERATERYGLAMADFEAAVARAVDGSVPRR